MKFLMNLLCVAILAGAAYCLYQQRIMQQEAVAIENSLEAVCSEIQEKFETDQNTSETLPVKN
ncbi:hypothetical protein [Candidatus Chromulinivorax destructor]|uniref:hypothetical protein n=1 Tax=Candidatus Chromulinivorax destructor TaxID=2066483 RepID=UPI0013B3F2C5|nr:hypothetical protein [Candidatus Chromulinivorax destructor]